MSEQSEYTTIRIKRKNKRFLDKQGVKGDNYDDILEKLMPEMKTFEEDIVPISTKEKKCKIES